MLCSRVVGFVKRHSTVPGAVVVFAVVWLVMLAVQAGQAGAAWVQAIGSILALIAAGLLPVAHQKLNDKRRGEERLLAISYVVDRALDEIWTLSACFISPQREFNEMSHYLRFGRPIGWSAITTGLSEIKLSELPPQWTRDFIQIRDAVAYASFVAGQMAAWLAEGHSNPEVITVLRGKRDLLVSLRSSLPQHDPEYEKQFRRAVFDAELAQGGSEPTYVGGVRFYARFERSRMVEIPSAVYVQPVFPADAIARAPVVFKREQLGWKNADDALSLSIMEAVGMLQDFDPQFPG